MDTTAPDVSAALALAVIQVNQAPVLAGSNPSLDSITEDEVNNAGITVAELISRVGPNAVSDADGDPLGIAVSVNNGNGATWQFRLAGQSVWRDVGTVSNASSLLLSGQDSIRLLPNAQEGAPANLGFRAWDQTSGTAGSYVSVTPTGGSSAFSSGVRSAQIAVSNVNDAPAVALTNTVTTLAENAGTTPRVKVADIVVTDDALGTESLSLAGADAALFEIDGTELFLVAGATLDFETNPALNVTVQVDDATVGASPDDTAALAIAVNAVNEAPTVSLANATTTLAENATTTARIKVADIVVTDDDLGAESLTLAGADAALFEIDGTELFLVAGATLDFETNPALNVTVQVDDATVGASPDDTAALVIAVTDVNESPTVTLIQTTTALAENATTPRVKVADIAVTDDALGTNNLTLAGADAALFEIDGTELFLIDGTALDFETNPALNVTVQVDDASIGASLDDTADLAITVVDVNEAPLILNNQLALVGGQILTLTPNNLLAGDPDSTPAQLVFTVDSIVGGRFQLATNPGDAVAMFTQEQVNNGDVQFVQLTPTRAPTYTLTVSDGVLSDEPFGAVVDFIPSALPTRPTELIDLTPLAASGDANTPLASTRSSPVAWNRVSAPKVLVNAPLQMALVNPTPRPTTSAVPTPRPAPTPAAHAGWPASGSASETPALSVSETSPKADITYERSSSWVAEPDLLPPVVAQPLPSPDALSAPQELVAEGAVMASSVLAAGSLAWMFRVASGLSRKLSRTGRPRAGPHR